MTLLEHLEELRNRLIWIVLSVGAAAIAGWVVFDPVVEALLDPAERYLTASEGKLIFTGPLEAFTLRLKVALYVGFGIAFPVVLFQVWRFVSPGLRQQEKKYAVPFISSGMLLFAVGVGFAFFTLPQALTFLIGPAIAGESITPLLAAKMYIDFTLLYLLAFGIAFEFPLILMFLTLLRVLHSRQLAKYRRHVFVGISFFVAFLTPSVDWVTMTVLTAAMYVLFEACIWLSRLFKR